MKKQKHSMRYGIVTLVVLLLFFSGVSAVLAQELSPGPVAEELRGLVHCGRELNTRGELANPCGFDDLIITAQNLVDWLVYISVFFAAALFTYAGYLYVTAGGSEEQVKKAHTVFRSVIVGFLIVLAAWLIVYTISTAVIDPEKTNILLLDSGNQ